MSGGIANIYSAIYPCQRWWLGSSFYRHQCRFWEHLACRLADRESGGGWWFTGLTLPPPATLPPPCNMSKPPCCCYDTITLYPLYDGQLLCSFYDTTINQSAASSCPPAIDVPYPAICPNAWKICPLVMLSMTFATCLSCRDNHRMVLVGVFTICAIYAARLVCPANNFLLDRTF